MQTIEIKTTQNVVIEHELAPVGSRILAWIIDTIILSVFIWLHVIIFYMVMDSRRSTDTAMVCMMIYLILVFILYNPICEIFFNGQSIGKRALNIRAIKLDRSRSDFQSFLIRGIFRMIDINLCLGSLAFIFISSSPKRQRLGDMLAHTAVVKTESSFGLQLSDLLNIDDIQKYTPVFPQVKMLHDEDIITIRLVLERFRNHPNKGHHEALNSLVFKLLELLEIDNTNMSQETFLKTLVKDYIVLTR